MDARDLMIGDWVQSSDGLDKITALCAAWAQCMKHSYGYSEIQPIPLTPEILEKNFSFNPCNDEGATEHYYWCGDYIDVVITEYTDDLWEIEVEEIETDGGFRTWKMYVSDVHELQHALRLCGFEREIEL